MSDNFSSTTDCKMYADEYVGGVSKLQDNSFDEGIRSSFLQQSAHYFGADWNDSKVLSLSSRE